MMKKGENTEPLVSIVIPIYNMADKIEKNVKKLFLQTYKNIEIILVDDGSTDNGQEICLNIQNKDTRIKFFHIHNSGAGIARNYGIKNATGKYVYFADIDDEIEKNLLADAVDAAESNNADLVVFGYDSCLKNGRNYSRSEMKKLTIDAYKVRQEYDRYFDIEDGHYIQGAPWNKLFSLEVIKRNNIKFPDLRRHQDEVFITRYINYCEKISFLEGVYYHYTFYDINEEGKKFPVNYIELLTKFYEMQTDILLRWNSQNQKMKKKIDCQFACKYIKALELLFAPKQKLTMKMRKQTIIKSYEEGVFKNIQSEQLSEYTYQKTIIKALEDKQYSKVYIILKMKIIFEKNFRNAFSFIKKNLK